MLTMPAPKRKSAAPAKSATPGANKIQDKLAKLGLRSDMDLVLHLPLRYEDETQIVPIKQADFMLGHAPQVEGVVTACDV